MADCKHPVQDIALTETRDDFFKKVSKIKKKKISIGNSFKTFKKKYFFKYLIFNFKFKLNFDFFLISDTFFQKIISQY
jgi:hypothetical protein